MNIFGFRPFKGRFNLGNSDDIPTNTDGTLIGAVKKINSDLNDVSEKIPSRVEPVKVNGVTFTNGTGLITMPQLRSSGTAIAQRKTTNINGILVNCQCTDGYLQLSAYDIVNARGFNGNLDIEAIVIYS